MARPSNLVGIPAQRTSARDRTWYIPHECTAVTLLAAFDEHWGKRLLEDDTNKEISVLSDLELRLPGGEAAVCTCTRVPHICI